MRWNGILIEVYSNYREFVENEFVKNILAKNLAKVKIESIPKYAVECEYILYLESIEDFNLQFYVLKNNNDFKISIFKNGGNISVDYFLSKFGKLNIASVILYFINNLEQNEELI